MLFLAYDPNESLTRAEVTVLINRVLSNGESIDGSTAIYKDVPAEHWAYVDIVKASIAVE